MAVSELIRKLNPVLAVSGKESAMADAIAEIIKPYVDEINVDPMGNLLAVKKAVNANESIMLSAHMDHIGFMVMEIDDKGRARIAPLGGINSAAYAYSTIIFESGIKGLLVPDSGTAAGDLKPEKLYVDFGAKSKKDIEKKVKIGDRCAVFSPVLKLLNNRISGSFQDNKIGCVCLIEAAKQIAEMKDLPYNVCYAFTAQEEVGCRGAKTAAYTLDPSYAINVDVYPAGDVPGGKSGLSLGGGTAIKIKDASVICSYIMVDHMKNCASDDKIPYQIEVASSGGTDTSAVLTSRGGVIAGALSVPLRYTHTQAEMLDISDVDNTVKLLVKASTTKVCR
ncbi:MAG: M42 family metallopeptidase [Ruminococcaceae bacterium]|nr:M42 family metallopeptidase [Oscillospiraceae bacterium]